MNAPLKSTLPYPGSETATADIFGLAEAYCQAADALFQTAKKGQKHTYAPFRLFAIHAIELYQNAFLRHEGHPPEYIRSRQQNLADEAFAAKLRLRKKTAHHLEAISANREYLISRYAPEQLAQLSKLNRLQATLQEVRRKVAAHLNLS